MNWVAVTLTAVFITMIFLPTVIVIIIDIKNGFWRDYK